MQLASAARKYRLVYENHVDRCSLLIRARAVPFKIYVLCAGFRICSARACACRCAGVCIRLARRRDAKLACDICSGASARPFDVDPSVSAFCKYTETERIAGKTCLAIYVLAYIYGAIFDDSMIVFIMLFCCMGAIIFLFIPQMIFHLFKGGLFSCRFVDALIIDALYNKFFIFIPTNKEYNELKKYMKLKFNKDLDGPNYLLRVKNF